MITAQESARLIRLAVHLEAEAESWCQGFAVWDGGKWVWRDPQYEWAHVRSFKLENGAKFLRQLAKSKIKNPKSKIPSR